MTSANIVKLPVQNLNKSDHNKNTDKKDNPYALSFQSEFKNIVQDLNQSSVKSVNSSNGISSLKSVISTYSLTTNSKVSINLTDKSADSKKSSPSVNKNKTVANTDKTPVKTGTYDEKSFSTVSDNASYNSIDNSTSKLSDKTTNDIKDVIEKRLGVSDEQLESAMEKLGLKYEDLQDPSNLLSLATYLVGNGNTQNLLLANGVKELMSDIKGIFSDANLNNLNGASSKDIAMQSGGDKAADQSSIQSVSETTDGMTVPSDENKAITYGTQSKSNADLTSSENAGNNLSTGSNANGNQNDGAGSKVQVVDLRTPGTENDTDATSDGKSDDTLPEVITGENTGNLESSQNDDGSNNDSSKFTKSPETAKSSETALAPEVGVNVNNSSVTFQSVYQQATTATSFSTSNYKGTNTENIINQIVQNAKVTLTDTEHTMEMVLNPHELGRIFMEVSSKDGALRAKIFTENESVKTALENQMQILQKNFDEKGFKIDAVEISVGAHQFKENQEKNGAGFDMFSQDRRGEGNETDSSADNRSTTRRINLNSLDGLRGLMTEEELLTAQIMKEQGNTVDYTA